MEDTICMDLYSPLSVPAVKGGAIETIVTTLINENEIYEKIKFVIISRYDKNAQKIARKYKNTQVIYIKDNKLFQKIHDKFLFLINKFSMIFFRKELYIRHFTYYKFKKIKLLKNIKSKLFILFGPDETYRELVLDKGKNKLVFYLHYNLKPNDLSEYITDKIIAVSKFVLDSYCKNAKVKVDGKVILNRVDETVFNRNLSDQKKNELRNLLNIKKDDFVIIYTGRINREKGIDEIIEAINKIENNNIKLMICGGVLSGANISSDYYIGLIHKINNSQKIIYTGYIDNNELYKYYQISDLQVVPSIVDEAAGLVNIEGMISGLPIITTDAGGIPEYVDENCSIILKRDSNLVEELKNTILLLYNDRDLLERMSKASLKRAQLFHKKEMYDEFVELMRYYKK